MRGNNAHKLENTPQPDSFSINVYISYSSLAVYELVNFYAVIESIQYSIMSKINRGNPVEDYRLTIKEIHTGNSIESIFSIASPILKQSPLYVHAIMASISVGAILGCARKLIDVLHSLECYKLRKANRRFLNEAYDKIRDDLKKSIKNEIESEKNNSLHKLHTAKIEEELIELFNNRGHVDDLVHKIMPLVCNFYEKLDRKNIHEFRLNEKSLKK